MKQKHKNEFPKYELYLYFNANSFFVKPKKFIKV